MRVVVGECGISFLSGVSRVSHGMFTPCTHASDPVILRCRTWSERYENFCYSVMMMTSCVYSQALTETLELIYFC